MMMKQNDVPFSGLGTGATLLPRVVAIKRKPLGGIIAQRVLTVHSLEDKH